MATHIRAEIVASISELKKNPMAAVTAGEGFPVAILNRNKPAFYCVPPAVWESLMDRLEDFELAAVAKEREGEPSIEVSLGKRKRNLIYKTAAKRTLKRE